MLIYIWVIGLCDFFKLSLSPASLIHMFIIGLYEVRPSHISMLWSSVGAGFTALIFNLCFLYRCVFSSLKFKRNWINTFDQLLHFCFYHINTHSKSLKRCKLTWPQLFVMMHLAVGACICSHEQTFVLQILFWMIVALQSYISWLLVCSHVFKVVGNYTKRCQKHRFPKKKKIKRKKLVYLHPQLLP